MTSRRQEKFNSLLKHLAAEFMVKNVRGGNAFITIAGVETSEDLKLAKISISIFPESREEEMWKIIKTKTGDLQKYIGEQLKTKFTPRLEFKKEILK